MLNYCLSRFDSRSVDFVTCNSVLILRGKALVKALFSFCMLTVFRFLSKSKSVFMYYVRLVELRTSEQVQHCM